MEYRRHRIALLAGSATLLLSLLGPHATAHPTTVDTDRTDNSMSFTYDADSGEMTTATWSRRTTRGDDKVDFEVGIRESEDAGSGLIGKLTLRLDGDHRTVYDGWFSLKVTTSDGDVAFHRQRPATIRLEPQPGRRRATLTFRIDVPSGSYKAAGSFKSE